MVADTRQVEEDGTVDLLHLAHFLLGGAVEVRIIVCVDLRTAQVVVPVRPRLDGVHVLASNHRDGARGGLVVAFGRVEQVLVVVGPGFEIVVELGQIRGYRRCWLAFPICPAGAAAASSASCRRPPSRRGIWSGPPNVSGIPYPAWSPRCSSTCTRCPCGRSRCSCTRWCRCGSRCIYPGERPSKLEIGYPCVVLLRSYGFVPSLKSYAVGYTMRGRFLALRRSQLARARRKRCSRAVPQARRPCWPCLDRIPHPAVAGASRTDTTQTSNSSAIPASG